MKTPGKQLALWIIEGVVFLLVFMGFMSGPGQGDPGRSRPPPD